MLCLHACRWLSLPVHTGICRCLPGAPRLLTRWCEENGGAAACFSPRLPLASLPVHTGICRCLGCPPRRGGAWREREGAAACFISTPAVGLRCRYVRGFVGACRVLHVSRRGGAAADTGRAPRLALSPRLPLSCAAGTYGDLSVPAGCSTPPGAVGGGVGGGARLALSPRLPLAFAAGTYGDSSYPSGISTTCAIFFRHSSICAEISLASRAVSSSFFSFSRFE